MSSHKCEICSGKGEIIDPSALNDGTEDFDRVECEECEGTGWIEHKITEEEYHEKYGAHND